MSAIVSVSLSGSMAKTRDAQRTINTKSITEALERYYLKNGEYPGCTSMTTSNLDNLSDTLGGIAANSFKMPKYSAGNAIICGDISSNNNDVIAYTEDTSANCASSGACAYFTLQYREEASGEIITINSRHSPSCVKAIPEGTCIKLDDGTSGANNTVKGYYEGKLLHTANVAFAYETSTTVYAGNHNTIISRAGYKAAVPTVLTHVALNIYGYNAGISGVNDLVMNPTVSASRQVFVVITGSYLTSSLSITSFQLKFDDGTTKSLSQAVADGYIEPLVLINSNLPWSTSCYWSNVLNLYTNTATSSVSFATANIVFNLKDHALTDVIAGLSKATNAKDGFIIQSVSNTYGVSLK